MSSVTLALMVRLPSASSPSSSISRRIASWLRRFSSSLLRARDLVSLMLTIPSITSEASDSRPKDAARMLTTPPVAWYADDSSAVSASRPLLALKRLFAAALDCSSGWVLASTSPTASTMSPMLAPRSSRVSRLSSLRLAAPPISCCTVSRNEVVSFSSCSTTSGSMTSDDSSRFAFFGMRWLSMTRWLARDTSRTPALASMSWLASCSATSCRSAESALMRRTFSFRATRLSRCDRIWVTWGAIFFHCSVTLPSGTRAAPLVAGTASSPSVRAARVFSNSVLPPARILNAPALPSTDCCAVSGRRCDSTRRSPARAS